MDGRETSQMATAILQGDARKNPHETDGRQRPHRCTPDDPLLAATEHALRQWDEIPRIFASPTYRLDNNEVERINRYISLTRRRLTIGSHSGAEAAALYHSLAITCHRCGVNVFDYFCDIIDRCAAWPPNTPIDKYRDLLPDRWKPSQK